MLLVGSILPAGAGGSQLWKLAAPAPANINLDTAAGAAGIVAEMPADSRYKISLTDTNADIPFKASILYFIDLINTVVSYVGVADFGIVTPIFGTRNLVSNNSAQLQAVNDQQINLFTDDNSSNSATVSSNNSNSVTIQISNISGAIGGKLLATNTEMILETYSNPANAKQLNFTMNTKFNFRDAVGNNLLAITNTGQLETNQTAASVAVRAKVAEMPIYNAAGALVGYIDINL